MSKRVRMERRAFRDERTGREVWQVTDGPFECVAPYMEKGAWTVDDRFLVFMANRGGAWQPYRLELATGEATQLHACEDASFRSVAVDSVHGEAYCQDGAGLTAVHVETLSTRRAVDYERFLGKGGGGKGHAAVLNRDGTRTAFSWQTPSGRGAIVLASTDGRNEFQIVELPRDDIHPGHELICPGDDDVLSFHGYPDRQNNPDETPAHRVAQWRLHRITREMTPLVAMPPGFRATHCLWGRSGDRFYLHRKTVPAWVPTALCSVDREGGDLRVHYETGEHRLGHSCASPGETWIVTDSQDPDENILLLAHTERDEQHLLCWPNTSINSNRPDKRSPDLPPHTDRHTHPGFSHTGCYVHFTSDVSGRSQVYVVPVDDVVRPGE